MRTTRILGLLAFALCLACARMPDQATITEPRATLLSVMLASGIDPEPEQAKKIDAPVTTPQQAWVAFRAQYPDDAKDCDGWAELNGFWLFSIRPADKKQEAGFKTFVYVKNGGTELRRFSLTAPPPPKPD